MKNSYELDSRYFREKLSSIATNADNYTPEEMERELMKCVNVAKSAKIPKLDLEFDANDLGEKVSYRYYLYRLLRELVISSEFNVKRPFGNSDWDTQMVIGLAEHEIIDYKYHPNTTEINYDSIDYKKGFGIIEDMIEDMCGI